MQSCGLLLQLSGEAWVFVCVCVGIVCSCILNRRNQSASASVAVDMTVGKGELKADGALAAVELPASQTVRKWNIASVFMIQMRNRYLSSICLSEEQSQGCMQTRGSVSISLSQVHLSSACERRSKCREMKRAVQRPCNYDERSIFF